jgi:thioredoxin 1
MSTNIVSPEQFAQELSSAENKDKQILVDFWAEWCGPCKVIGPILNSVESSDENVVLLKVDVEENQQLAGMFRIQSIPTLMFFKNGAVNAEPIIGLVKQEAIEQRYKEV